MSAFGKSQGGGRRVARRETAPLFAVYSTVTQSRRAEVVDVSATGVRLRSRELPQAGEALDVTIEAARGFGTVIWSESGECGIAFDEPLTPEEVAVLQQRVAQMAALPEQVRAALEDWMTGFAR